MTDEPKVVCTFWPHARWRVTEEDGRNFIEVQHVEGGEWEKDSAGPPAAEIARLTRELEEMRERRDNLETQNDALAGELEKAGEGWADSLARWNKTELALRAERDELAESVAGWKSDYNDLAEEDHALQKEHNALAERVRELEGEQELLVRLDEDELADRESIQAERDRLRVALESIAEYGKDGICPYGCDTPDIAAKALRESRGQEKVSQVGICLDMPKARYIAEQIAEGLDDLPVWDACEETAAIIVRCVEDFLQQQEDYKSTGVKL